MLEILILAKWQSELIEHIIKTLNHSNILLWLKVTVSLKQVMEFLIFLILSLQGLLVIISVNSKVKFLEIIIDTDGIDSTK